MFLTNRLVSDPPEFTREVEAARRDGKLKIDGLGIFLVALGFASLEVVLDRGQTEDWFGSNFIVAFFSIAIVALVAPFSGIASQRSGGGDSSPRRTNFRIANIFYFLSVLLSSVPRF